ncbi:MAG: glycoside hydrolase family 2 [Clostridia bacterium]|nr:glycoside hydrolase family 2 [Clostridia bacterium]
MQKNSLFPPLSYPRPLLWRDSFFSLDGEWELAFASQAEEPAEFPLRVTVPFPVESALSGIEKSPVAGEFLYYRKRFSLPDGFCLAKTVLHFTAVDQEAEVFLNGASLGSHLGGYLPFSFDVTPYLEEENVLTVRVSDPLDRALPYGKQTKRRGGMWYTPFSGIWGTVWLESFPEGGITDIRVTGDDKSVTLSVNTSAPVTLSYTDGDECVSVTFEKSVTVTPRFPHLWSPNDPYLYHATLKTEDDEAKTYFALRKLEAKQIKGKSRLLLNGEPIFLHGVLDQGYFADGISTPSVPEEYEKDILRMKSLGFNMLRKHIKIESQVYYSLCDRHGMILCQDAVNNGRYSFLWQTALPTVGMKRIPTFLLFKSKRAKEIFAAHTEETVAHLASHPSLLLFTIFNEGWGQSDPRPLYESLKAKYPHLLFDSASGWFRTSYTDFRSDHVYFKPVRACYGKVKKPVFLSEFGGYSLPVEGHTFPSGKNYGYTVCASCEAFEERLRKLYLGEVCPAIEKGLSAAVYTQLSDVEDETNGLYTYDRQVQKASTSLMLSIKKELDGALAAAVKE